MLYLTWGWRYKVTGSVYPAFVSIQPQGRVRSLSLLPSTCGYQVYKILQQVRRLINLVWHPPRPLVLSVPVCYADGVYPILHSVTLQWPVAFRPPWEIGIPPKPQPSDPAWADLSESTAYTLYTSQQKLWDQCWSNTVAVLYSIPV